MAVTMHCQCVRISPNLGGGGGDSSSRYLDVTTATPLTIHSSATSWSNLAATSLDMVLDRRKWIIGHTSSPPTVKAFTLQ